MAIDIPAGMLRFRPSKINRSVSGYRKDDSHARGSGPGDRPDADLELRRGKGTPAHRRRQRSTAATGAAAPSSAQLKPPKAIRPIALATTANVTSRSKGRAPVLACQPRPCEDSRVADQDQDQAPGDRLLPQPGGPILQLEQQPAALHEAIDNPARQAEESDLLRRLRIHREPVRVLGITLCGTHRRGVAILPNPLSRSQWVEPQAITKTTGAHHAKPAKTTAAPGQPRCRPDHRRRTARSATWGAPSGRDRSRVPQ